MLPEWKQLRKKTRKLKIPDEPYFELADEYTFLKQKFEYEDTLELLYSWVDMILYPLYIVIRLCMLDFSISFVISLAKTYQLWIDWFRLKDLEARVDHWKQIVRSSGGPWISTNDPMYHTFVYADGMERIRYSKMAAHRPSQKTEKTCPKVQHPVQSQVSSPLKFPLVPSEVPLVP